MGQSFDHDDYADSDDMQEVLEYTSKIPQTSSVNGGGSITSAPDRDLKRRIAETEAELRQFDEDIANLRRARNRKASELEELKQTLQSRARPSTTGAKGINYQEDAFDWDQMLLARSKAVFDIPQFRLCQRGVCNANIDGRDIVCIMPTGGGKSLTYQLPALLTPGCTLIVSPLIALIEDQVMNLRQHNVEAVMLLGSTKGTEKKEIIQRLYQMADGRVPDSREIKLCYVTPEKLAKDKSFMTLLHRLSSAGKLARIVIDEAHCVSSYGHDFRPDYRQLHILKGSFPSVPIMALSATCPPKVLQDLVDTLRLPPVTPGESANTGGTVHFTAPLYRKNLHYKVMQKPSQGEAVYKSIVEWILEHHANESGIVYCYSKKDTENCAAKLKEISGGKIRTGVYHADVPSEMKSAMHDQWRSGRVHVVCATIAFGLGIDKGDVRFVIHHTISKSLEGYYQESGRAGRDGKDSDCLLYYRPQDASNIGGMIAGDKEASKKLRDMLSFVEELVECRKLQFANYFRHSWDLSLNSWTTVESSALDKCGHCDNCLRSGSASSPSSSTTTTRPKSTTSQDKVVTRDVTLAAWQLLKLIQATQNMNSNQTLAAMAKLARGLGGGKVEAKKGGRGKARAKEVVSVDLERVCGGPVKDLSTEEMEHLLVQLMIKEYVGERVVTTAWAANMYLCLGPQAAIYLHLSMDDVKRRQQRMEIQFLQQEKASKLKRASTAKKGGDSSGKTANTKEAVGDTASFTSSSPSSSIIPRKRTTEDMKGKGKVWVYEDDESDSGENIDVDAILEAEGYRSSDDEDDSGNDDDVDREIEGGIFGSKTQVYQQSSRQRQPLATSGRPTASTRTGTNPSWPPHAKPPPTGPPRSSALAAGSSSKLKSKLPEIIDISDSESDDDGLGGGGDDDGWAMNLRGAPPRKKARNSLENEDIISLSD